MSLGGKTALLTGAGEDGGVYIPAGPEILTYQGVAERLSRGAGTEIPLRVPPVEEYRAEMTKAGYPQAQVSYVADYFSALRRGDTALAVITDDVLRLTGRRPRSVEEFAAGHAESLRPKQQA